MLGLRHDAHIIVLAGGYAFRDQPRHPELFRLACRSHRGLRSHKMLPERPIRIVDQWMLLTSVSCGSLCCVQETTWTSFSSSRLVVVLAQHRQVQEIQGTGQIYTMLKVDQVSNLGAARFIRSLMAALNGQQAGSRRLAAAGLVTEAVPECSHGRWLSGKARAQVLLAVPIVSRGRIRSLRKVTSCQRRCRKRSHTILAPPMAPIPLSGRGLLKVRRDIVLLPSG